jgi:hypothetical protein
LRNSGVSVVSVIERLPEADSVFASVQPATPVEMPVEDAPATSLLADSVASATELPAAVSVSSAPKNPPPTFLGPENKSSV